MNVGMEGHKCSDHSILLSENASVAFQQAIQVSIKLCTKIKNNNNKVIKRETDKNFAVQLEQN